MPGTPVRMAIRDASRPMPENNAIVTSGLLSDLSDEPVGAEIGTKIRATFDISGFSNAYAVQNPSLGNSRRSCDEGSTHSAKYLHQMMEPDNATDGTIRQITLPGCNDFGQKLASIRDRSARPQANPSRRHRRRSPRLERSKHRRRQGITPSWQLRRLRRAVRAEWCGKFACPEQRMLRPWEPHHSRSASLLRRAQPH
jgi:hypothetical protein